MPPVSFEDAKGLWRLVFDEECDASLAADLIAKNNFFPSEPWVDQLETVLEYSPKTLPFLGIATYPFKSLKPNTSILRSVNYPSIEFNLELFPALKTYFLRDEAELVQRFEKGVTLCLRRVEVAEIEAPTQKTSVSVRQSLSDQAKLLYGASDPAFVEEYQNYLQFNANSADDALKSPEDYRKTGFLNLPPRPQGTPKGTQFMTDVLGVNLENFEENPRQLGKLSKVERENAILEQIELGNIPDFLRRPTPVTLKGPDGSEVKTYVMPDYIAIGSDDNFVRMPLSPIVAKALADKYGLSLPTKTIVEETYAQAGKQVVGPFYSGKDEMEKNSFYLDSAGFYYRSSEDIQHQLEGIPPGTLVAGGKKELVISSFVSQRYVGTKPDESIAFYGLYDSNGIPIQKSPGHGGESGYRHTEYALGVRFISPMIVYTNAKGEKKVMKMDEALQDPEVAKIVNRLERTDKNWQTRSTLMDGLFDPATVYRQKPSKDQKMPHGPRA